MGYGKWIGRWTREKASRGPKCRGRRARLDIGQGEKQAEVQNTEEEE